MPFCKACYLDNVKSPIFETDAELHRHLKKHKIKVNEYYVRYFALKDLHTGELLPFKNTESYFGNDFLNRKNCIDYLIALPKEKLQEELKRIFIKRKEYKKLVYVPCQVELKSSPLPNIQFFKSNQIDYNKFCEDIGLKIRYDYGIKKLEFNEAAPMEWLQDSREQKGLNFGKDNVIISALDCGDYVCKSHFKNIFFERKSPADFISTLASLERFEREIIRAKELDSYLIIVCEEELNLMLNFDKEKFLNKNIYFKPEFIMYNVKYLIQKYDHIQFLFVKGRSSMVEVMRKIYLCRSDVRNYDLQYCYEKGIL